jgi:hypothetical protein
MEAHRVIDAAPQGAVVNVKQARRTLDQNALMWSRLSDISRAKPEGRTHSPEMWKALVMHACGHAVQFENGLDGQPFPVGFRSSRLTKAQMGELLDFIDAFAARHGIKWTDEGEGA